MNSEQALPAIIGGALLITIAIAIEWFVRYQQKELRPMEELQTDPEPLLPPRTQKLFSPFRYALLIPMILIGLGFLGYGIYLAVTDYDGFATKILHDSDAKDSPSLLTFTQRIESFDNIISSPPSRKA